MEKTSGAGLQTPVRTAHEHQNHRPDMRAARQPHSPRQSHPPAPRLGGGRSSCLTSLINALCANLAAHGGKLVAADRWSRREASMRLSARRTRWVVATAIAAIVLIAAVTTLLFVHARTDYGERVTGPYGMATSGSPNRPALHILREVSGAARFAGSLMITTAGGGDGVTATDPVTGRQYWTYARPGKQVVTTSADSSDVFILWADGVLVRLDPRTVQVRWHARLDPADSGVARLWRATGVILLDDDSLLEAVRVGDGSVAWSARVDHGCSLMSAPAITASVIASAAACPNGETVVARDLATGKTPLDPRRACHSAGSHRTPHVRRLLDRQAADRR